MKREAGNQKIQLDELEEKEVELWIKREDLLHPLLPGNKMRKLHYNLLQAKEEKHHTLLTFGGAYSNHILATAAAGALFDFHTIGIIRGEELALEQRYPKNPTLAQALQYGMKLDFVSRKAYREKESEPFLKELTDRFGIFYKIPEGGTNLLAIKGCEEILQANDQEFHYICVSVGTGGTLCGILRSKAKKQKVLGFLASRYFSVTEPLGSFALADPDTMLLRKYDFGGYAKFDDKLIQFINFFSTNTGILLDPVYTGKMLYGIMDLICQDFFKKGTKIMAIHTGGIQGISGVNQILRKKNKTCIIT